MYYGDKDISVDGYGEADCFMRDLILTIDYSEGNWNYCTFKRVLRIVLSNTILLKQSFTKIAVHLRNGKGRDGGSLMKMGARRMFFSL